MQQTSNKANSGPSSGDSGSHSTKSKAKRTRYRPVWLYVMALVLFGVSSTFAISDDMCLTWLSNLTDFLSGPSPVKWLSRSEALAASARTGKPILYVALPKHDFSSIRLIGEGLHDKLVARLINENYLPVRVDFDPKKRGEDLKDFSNQFYINNVTTLAVVPAAMIHANQQDLMSSSNPAELGLCDLSLLERGEFYGNPCYYGGYGSEWTPPGYFARRGPVLSGFKTKQDLVEFLSSGMLWHKLPPTLGKVAWQPPSTLQKPVGNKKRLIFFVENYGASSDSMRLHLFWNPRSYKVINEKFEPVLLQFNRDNPSADQAGFHSLEDKYGISTLPAIVIDDGKNPPAVQFGFNNLDSTLSFMNQGRDSDVESNQNFVPAGKTHKPCCHHTRRR